MHTPELLAPVGSKEALMAAVENGADAVYFGGRLFSARQYASNFNREELEWAIDYAHVRGVRAYVTVNTLIKDSELDEACDYLHFLCNAGADAVIVQDMGILKLLREQLPQLPVHASTQMTIHNVEGVKFLQDMGVKRVVLARELSLEEIQRIKAETGIEIETFIHGALCFSYSGQCLLSSMIGGRSGNRGYCAQPCRKKYRAGDVEGYLLSPKDLNMSGHIPDLVEAGIDSFKIEGRMKRPEYVAGVVRVYRRLIDRYVEAPGKFFVSESEKHTLLQLFNREFTTGYFFGNPGSGLMSRKYPHNRGTELGYVVDYDQRKKLVSIFLKSGLQVGDGIGAGLRETGITVRSIYLGNKRVSSAKPGSIVTIPLDHEVAGKEPVFKTYDSGLMASLELKNIRKIPVRIAFEAHIEEHAKLLINDRENEITVQGAVVNRADKKPLSRSSISDQLIKLGNTIFDAQEINIETDENIFLPISLLNSLRREAISRLERTRTQKWKRRCIKPGIPAWQKFCGTIRPILSVNTGSIRSFEAAVNGGADVVYIGGEMFARSQMNEDERRFIEKEDYYHAIEYGRKKGVKVLFDTPRIIKNIDELRVKEFFSLKISRRDGEDITPDGFLVSNPGVLYYLRILNSTIPIVIDHTFNIFNRLTMGFLSTFSQRVTLSPELTLKEIAQLAHFGPVECFVQGNFPLMVSEHDLAGDIFSRGSSQDICLKDEKGFIFPVRTDMQGRTYILNSRDLCMLEYVQDLIKAGVNSMRIDARTYDPRTTEKITQAYREAIDKSTVNRKCSDLVEHTTGHYFRGVL